MVAIAFIPDGARWAGPWLGQNFGQLATAHALPEIVFASVVVMALFGIAQLLRGY